MIIKDNGKGVDSYLPSLALINMLETQWMDEILKVV